MIGTSDSVLVLTANIVSAHTRIPTGALPNAIREVYQALKDLEVGETAPTAAARRRSAVPVKKSVLPDHIVCLDCGRHLQMLKRHLLTEHNLTTAQYRIKWGLDADYPMTAPNYTEKRSTIAKRMGLGTGRNTPTRV
ncbi:MAG: hypothetical protein QG621_272 [Patescibacteria group bacterium]|jgi:predicted transcriptional regulator|nr:hypothetical protein [Patescibacteria group bacterium]